MKIFITGPLIIDKYKISEGLYNMRPSEYKITLRFTTDKDNKLLLHLDNIDINLGYKNNAFLYIKQNKETEQFEGITMDEFHYTNIIPIELQEFNCISECVLENNDILVVWIDTKLKYDIIQKRKDIIETKFLIDRINYAKLRYLYFCQESNKKMIEVIDEYVNNVEKRQSLFEIYQ